MSSEIASMRIDPSEPALCAVCGKDMFDHVAGGTFVGMHIGLIVECDWHQPKFYREQLGAFAPLIVPAQDGDEPGSVGSHAEVDICWECWFKSMGIPVPDQTFEVTKNDK